MVFLLVQSRIDRKDPKLATEVEPDDLPFSLPRTPGAVVVTRRASPVVSLAVAPERTASPVSWG